MNNQCVKKLFFKFALPSVMGMLVVAIQIMIDGMFIANALGAKGLAAVNLSMPLISLFTSVTLMISSGGSVITGIYLGEGKNKKASETRSFTFILFIVVIGILSILSLIFLNPIMKILGVESGLILYVKPYLSTMILLSMLYNSPLLTETFIKLEGRPNLVFLSGTICLIGNILLDYLFIIKMNGGMTGAALATCIATGGGTLALLNSFKFEKPKGDFKLLKDIFYNGSSEMLSLLSSSVTVYIFNQAVLKSIGELGVSALTVVFYINSLVNITLYGLGMALQPIVSYNLGAKNKNNIYKVLQISLLSGGAIGLLSFLFMRFYSAPLIEIFTKDNRNLASLTSEVIYYFTFAYIISFINIISGAFHTAVGRPFESAMISFCKSIVFIAIPLIILPYFLGNIGIWLATPIGEFLCLFLSISFMVRSLKSLPE